MRRTAGFTIIELVAVIVILGILAAVALPRYLDLSTSARNAACQSWKGSIEGGSAINFAARTASSTAGSALTTCGTGGATGIGAVVSGGLPTSATSPSAYISIVSGTLGSGAVTNGTTGSCVIEYVAGGGSCQQTVNVIAIN